MPLAVNVDPWKPMEVADDVDVSKTYFKQVALAVKTFPLPSMPKTALECRFYILLKIFNDRKFIL
jgi:hypothetical protein